MEALAERLSRLDEHAEDAVRVVTFYDTLMRRRVDLPALARASAVLGACVAGIRLQSVGQTIRLGPDGRDAPEPPGPASTTASITLDGEEIGTAWLERPGPPVPLDELLLERFAIAAAAVVERYGPARTTMADPALVELVIGGDEGARARALRLLGFAVDAPLRVVAVRTQLPLDRVGTLICPDHPVKATALGDVGVIVATTVDATRFPTGVRAGVGAVGSGDRSWRQARTALRFTTTRQPVVHHAELGALALLAEVAPDSARDNVDVDAVARLAARSPDAVDTLDAYCVTGSHRRAAEILHLHHSSVVRRLDQIADALAIPLTETAGLTRARVALAAWRLLESP
jgi:hypothetical protein